MMSIDELLKPYKNTKDFWYLVPRAFWPYPKVIHGIPGFHYFLQVLIEHQKTNKIWNREKELEVLQILEDKKITPPFEKQEDYHVHFRNRINFAKKTGFAFTGDKYPLILTPIGKYFLKSNQAHWQEIFEHQLIRFEFTNPSLPNRYEQFSLFPYMFTLSILLELDYVSIKEFILRVSLSRSHDEREYVLNWINNFRKLSDSDMQIVSKNINLNRNYSARMILLLFSYTPCLDFVNNTLILTDKDHARIIFSKCWPHLTYTKYKTFEEWIVKFGNFDSDFWPLLPEVSQIVQKEYKNYIKREESDAHKEIKKHLIEKCEVIFCKGARLVEEEYFYASGDRANIIFSTPSGLFLAVEVEVNINKNEIPGLLQAIKYKYMYAAQEGLRYDQVLGFLVARKIHKRIKDMCIKYNIHYYEQATGNKSFDETML